MYLAPENGYRDVFIFGQAGAEPRYNKGLDKQFFLRTADGRHARLRMDVNTDSSPSYSSYFGLKWWLNPKPGSRNLECDRAKSGPVPTSRP